jgi:hypothetical protein
MTQVRRTSRRLRSTIAVAALVVAAAVLAPVSAQATVTFKKSSLVAHSVQDSTPSAQSSTPSGAVGGVQSPAEAGSTLNLEIDASEAGAGLASAQASIGPNSVSVSLCSHSPSLGGECPESVSNVPLSIDVGGEGAHYLLITVTDTAGKTATLVDRTINVMGPPVQGSNAVTLGVAGGTEPTGPPPHEPPEHEPPEHEERPPPPPVCASPMLAMRLASRPLGYTSRLVPVLRAGRPARFVGRLTCLHGRNRVPAPDGTPVRVLYEHSGCALGHPRCESGSREHIVEVHKGRLKVRLRIVGPGTVIFSYLPPDGESVEVRLQVAVALGESRGYHPSHRRHRHRGRHPGHRRHHGRARRHHSGRRR